MTAPALILVRPQLGENIGAAARAMSNFGLTDLRLVAPKNGWPNERAFDMATGNASFILEKAGLFKTLPEAMHGITLAYATTARDRDLEKRVVEPRELAREIHERSTEGERCAILFGPERTGLENEDLALADAIVTIPTDAANASLNLSQAAVVLAYEWFTANAGRATLTREAKRQGLATKEELQGFFDHLEEYLDAVDHFRTEDKKTVMWQNLRAIFLRASLSDQEVKTLRGVIRALFARRLGSGGQGNGE